MAAALLAAERRDGGPEVVGVWMRLSPDEGEGHELRRSCCSPDAADDARRVAQLAGIPFFVLNLEREFGSEVIDAFVDGYLEGATPNPCQACNQHIKFDVLLQRGLAAYGADAVATGHYARVATDARGRHHLLRARDTAKDQTYFLWTLTQAQLAATRFPLGELTKPEVRAIAAELALPTATKPESQEICFVPLGDYRALLAERRGYEGEPGLILDADGYRGRYAHRLRALHGGPAARARARAGRGRLRPRGRAGDEHRRHRSAGRDREPVVRSRRAATSSPASLPRTGSRRRFASATGPSRSPAR